MDLTGEDCNANTRGCLTMHQSRGIHLAVSIRHKEADHARGVHQAGVPLRPVLGGHGDAPHGPRLVSTDQPLYPGGGEAGPGAALSRHALPDLVRGPRNGDIRAPGQSRHGHCDGLHTRVEVRGLRADLAPDWSDAAMLASDWLLSPVHPGRGPGHVGHHQPAQVTRRLVHEDARHGEQLGI